MYVMSLVHFALTTYWATHDSNNVNILYNIVAECYFQSSTSATYDENAISTMATGSVNDCAINALLIVSVCPI